MIACAFGETKEPAEGGPDKKWMNMAGNYAIWWETDGILIWLAKDDW